METILFKLSLLILSSLCLKLVRCDGADRITPTRSLSGDQTIVSAGGVFELGFFKPGKSGNYCVGIWYKQVSPRTVVWVANRNSYSPLPDRFSAELKITDYGYLALHDGSNREIWSTGMVDRNFRYAEAVLLDDGNLVLTSNGSSPISPNQSLWQSFDHPGDTWIPGGKIGFNKVKEQDISLTSWRNREDPATGPFSLKLGPNRSLELRNMYTAFRASESFSGRVSGSISEMKLKLMSLSYVDNRNESYLTYSQYNISQLAQLVEEPNALIKQLYESGYNGSLFSRYVVDVRGKLQLLAWQESTKQWLLVWSHPRSQCQVDGYCGPYGSCMGESSRSPCQCLTGFVPLSQVEYSSEVFYRGCYRSSPLECRKPDWFLPNYNVKLPDKPETAVAGSPKDCEAACLRSCSCTAYSHSGDQCFTWYGVLMNLQQDVPGGQTIFIKLAGSDSKFPSSENKKRVIIGCVVGSVIVLLAITVSVVIVRLRKKRKAEPGKVMEGSSVAFTQKELKIATRNFTEKLGEGGFGSVYKGTLPDSSVVAVKKLDGVSFSQGDMHKQFLAEVRTLGTIQHINLVGLRGFASDPTRMLLVYDYMPNGSLASHLFTEEDAKTLEWKTRYNIALGTARGLGYLHEKCRECIIHCDIKPDNILLDSEFIPKVADFGMAKLFGRDFSRVLTTFRGTIGYLAPEWLSGEAITAKADVYSYGMMLFELVSGRRNSQHTSTGHYFPTWVATVVNEGGNVLDLLDPRLNGNADIEEVGRVCRVALWCIQGDESHRLTMGQVVYVLEKILEVNIPPIPRILQTFTDLDSNGQQFWISR
ncbi:unnamed protein product [Linum tenue]|uniref:Receptor-like serine/threonine-protein kinase n=1 Tax=Linum tenue TaxID=586396 RepID=A0AAV0H3K8_9ROSI|nr:unnamed protein product [Linum tenue]